MKVRSSCYTVNNLIVSNFVYFGEEPVSSLRYNDERTIHAGLKSYRGYFVEFVIQSLLLCGVQKGTVVFRLPGWMSK